MEEGGMKHLLITAALTSLALVIEAGTSKAQIGPAGPGEAGAVLKDPFATPVPARPTSPTQQSYVESLLDKNTPPGVAPGKNTLAEKLAALAPSAASTLNDDIKIKETDGPFVIYIQGYVGEDCHRNARQLALELRTGYNLKAFTFDKGAKEKQKEYDRIVQEVARKRELLRQRGINEDVPIRVGFMNIQEQCAVILGGYRSEDAARRALDSVHKLKPLDPTRVMLDKLYSGEMKHEGAGPPSLYSKTSKLEEGYVNPFLGAFVTRNPKIEAKRPVEWDKLDIGELRKLNAGESFSLLECKKPWTLVVKDFRTPSTFQQKSEKGSFLESIGLSKSHQRIDAAAESAHNLAELLRKSKLEAYVLHTRYTSIVCVGGYEGSSDEKRSPLEDPRMRAMAEIIESKVLPQIAQLFPQVPGQPAVQSGVVPMRVPR
jgi:hypothetical protein